MISDSTVQFWYHSRLRTCKSTWSRIDPSRRKQSGAVYTVTPPPSMAPAGSTLYIEGALKAAVKGMEEVERRVRRTLLEPSILEKKLLRIIAIAYCFHYEATVATTCPLPPSLAPNDITCEYYSGTTLKHQPRWPAVYRTECGHAAWRLRAIFPGSSRKKAAFDDGQSVARASSEQTLACWCTGHERWVEYMKETLAILRETPCAAYQNAKSTGEGGSCTFCRRKSQPYMSGLV